MTPRGGRPTDFIPPLKRIDSIRSPAVLHPRRQPCNNGLDIFFFFCSRSIPNSEIYYSPRRMRARVRMREKKAWISADLIRTGEIREAEFYQEFLAAPLRAN